MMHFRPRVERGLFPLYLLSFSGDFLLSLMIVASVLVGTRNNVDEWIIGLLGSAYGISYMVSPVLLGRISDKIGRKRSMGLACAGIVLTSVVFVIFSNNVPVVLACQVAVGVLNGFYWPSMEAFTSESTCHEEAGHKKGIGNFCIAWSLGYMTGPLVAPILDDFHPVYSFIIVGVTAGINLAIVSRYLNEPAPREDRPRANSENTTAPPLDDKRGPKTNPVIYLSAMLLCLSITYALVKGFLLGVEPEILKGPSHAGLDGFTTGLLLFSFGAGRTVAFIVQSRFQLGRDWQRVLVSFLASSTLLVLAVPFSLPLVSIVFPVAGAMTGLVYGSSLERIMKVNESGKGFVAGLFEATMGIGTFASAIVGGIALAMFSAPGAHLTVGLMSVAVSQAALFFLVIFTALTRKAGN